jgi:hypothetical protein
MIPSTHTFLENSFIHLSLNPSDGSLTTLTLKKQDVRLHLSQKFMAYDGKIQTNSGLYVFNPHHPAVDYHQDIKLVKVYVFEGRLMKCVQSFHQVSKYRDMLFSNKICVEYMGEG